MDAITYLKKDHQTVEQLFKRYERAGDNAFVEKKAIVDRITEELSKHAAIEEQLFYPVAQATVSGIEDVALESLEEHHVVKVLLAELQKMDAKHERFDAKVTVLIENVRHHVEEEEGEFFPKVRDQLGRSSLADLGDSMAHAKAGAPSKPHPAAPDSAPGNMITGPISGVVDKVGDTLSGVAQGGVNAVQDVIDRILRRERSRPAPTGSSSTRRQAEKVRAAPGDVTDAAIAAVREALESTESAARSAAEKGERVASTAGRGARRTARTAKTGAKRTARTAKTGAKRTATAAKSGAKSTTTSARTATRSTTAAAKRSVKASGSQGKNRAATAAKAKPRKRTPSAKAKTSS